MLLWAPKFRCSLCYSGPLPWCSGSFYFGPPLLPWDAHYDYTHHWSLVPSPWMSFLVLWVLSITTVLPPHLSRRLQLGYSAFNGGLSLLWGCKDCGLSPVPRIRGSHVLRQCSIFHPWYSMVLPVFAEAEKAAGRALCQVPCLPCQKEALGSPQPSPPLWTSLQAWGCLKGAVLLGRLRFWGDRIPSTFSPGGSTL